LIVPGVALGTALAFVQRHTGATAATGGIGYAGQQFQEIKKMKVYITKYSPCVGSNTCDCPVSMGGDESTADGQGRFKFQDGGLKWVWNDGSETEDYIFAEPSDHNVIPWDQRNQLAVVIPGFKNNLAIHVRDSYAPGLHAGEPFLDLVASCSEYEQVGATLQSMAIPGEAQKEGGIPIEVSIVDTTKPIGNNFAGSCGAKIVQIASREVGQTVTNDCNKYSGSCLQWCAAFATWVYKQAGYMTSVQPGTVALKENRQDLNIVDVKNNISNIRPGDIFWVHASSASGFHVGIVESIANDGIHTIEGNIGKEGNVDRVDRRVKKLDQILTVARPKSCK